MVFLPAYQFIVQKVDCPWEKQQRESKHLGQNKFFFVYSDMKKLLD